VLFILLDLVDFSRPRLQIDFEGNIRLLLEFNARLMSGNLDSYQTLGVSPSVPKAKVKMAYLRLSRQFHPDHFGSAAAPEIKKIAASVLREIEAAYRDLKKKFKQKRKEERLKSEKLEDLDLNFEPDENYEIDLEESPQAELPDSQEPVGEDKLESHDVEIEDSDQLREGEVGDPRDNEGFDLFGEEAAVEQKSPGPGDAGPGPVPREDAEPAILSMKDEMKEIVQAKTFPTEDLPVVTGNEPAGEDPGFPAEADIFEEAEELYMEKKYHEAARLLKPALKKNPDKAEYLYLLGLCQTHMEFFQSEAERHLKRAIELNPWNSDPVYALGMLFRMQGKTKQAAHCFERVMKISKDHSKAVKAMRELSIKKRKKSTLFSFLKKDNKDK
jgi:tetratricopeptide (TPR) repeat protein